MADIAFYHLEHLPLEKALPALLDKVISSGKKAVVRMQSQGLLTLLDQSLWTAGHTKFIPHTAKKDADTEHTPIFLTMTEENPISADVLIVLEGSNIFEDFSRVLVMFNGQDAGELAEARARWKILKDAGHTLTYWQQESNGGWKKAA